MPKFNYEIKKDSKEIIKDTLIAENRSAAIQKMSKAGYFILTMVEEDKILNETVNSSVSLFNRVGLKDITIFTRQVSDLLESGFIIVRALDIVCDQTENRRFKSIIADVRDFCIAGNTFSSALARHPRVFSDLYVSMVHSGETSGALENVLKRLTDFNEKQLEIQTKLRTSLAYPILMSFIGCATIIVLLTFVMPKMMVMFSDLDQALPLPTQILLGISYVLANYWWVVISAVIVVIIVFMKIYATSEGRLVIDGFKLRLPLAGKLIKKIEIARFSRTLATLLNNGVSILEALDIVADTMGNAVIRLEITKAAGAVREGQSLAKGFHNSEIIPLAVINMISIGEDGGYLEKSLFKLAEINEKESDEAIKIVMTLLEPLMILVLGLIVGFIVVAMLLPIFEINFVVQ